MFLLLVAFLTRLVPSCLAWEGHALITRLAIEDIPAVHQDVPVVSLESYLKAVGFEGSERDFLRDLEVNQNAGLSFKAGEITGGSIELARVLEIYSDEPDHGMDQELFGQYPSLWKQDYVYMGGLEKGTPSQSFRHMYWPSGYFKLPPSGGKEPVYDPKSLGEAPARAQFFFEKSLEAFRRGHPYWGARFLAWSLHYLQDLTQPFHAEQLPSRDFIRRRPGGGIDLKWTAKVLAYYHFAFEIYCRQALLGEAGPEAQDKLRAALSGSFAAFPLQNPGEMAQEAARRARRQAAGAGNASVAFFPAVSDSPDFDPAAALNGREFWEEVRGNQKAKSAVYSQMIDLLQSELAESGKASRALVMGALSVSKADSKPVLPEDMERYRLFFNSGFDQ